MRQGKGGRERGLWVGKEGGREGGREGRTCCEESRERETISVDPDMRARAAARAGPAPLSAINSSAAPMNRGRTASDTLSRDLQGAGLGSAGDRPKLSRGWGQAQQVVGWGYAQ